MAGRPGRAGRDRPDAAHQARLRPRGHPQPRGHRLKPARELADLPYARYLQPFAGTLAPSGDHDCVHFAGLEIDEAASDGAKFLECAFTDSTLRGGALRRARFSDVWLHAVRLAGTDLAGSRWVDAELAGCALSGAQLPGADLRNVAFHDCKLTSVNLSGARLQDVTFVGCTLDDLDLDLGGASLERVDFAGSVLTGVRVKDATLVDVDLGGAVELRVADGFESLRGATVNMGQLLDLAPEFARVLGVRVAGAQPPVVG